MKIAFFVNTFPSLSQTFILSQVLDLLNKGHELDIYALKNGVKKDTIPLLEELESNNKVHFYRKHLNIFKKNRFTKYLWLFYNFSLALINNPKALAKFIKTTDFGKKIESFSRFNDVLYFLHGKKLSYEIIHCHFGPNGSLAALLKEIGILQGKLITTFHGYDMSSYLDKKGRDAYELLFRVGDMFLPVSERWKRELIALGGSAEKIRVHRMGVELDRVKQTRRTGRETTVNILTVARLVEKKGIEYGIRAVSEALKRHPQLTFRIIGDGPLRGALEGLIDELGVKEKIELLGWKSQDEVFTMLNNTDIFLSPSVTDAKGDQEGIPVVLMEAMAHGLPVLATWHSGIPELVEDGVYGFLVPERDVDTLTERLVYLVANPEIRLRMGDAGRNFVVNNYNNEKLNEHLVAIYESLYREQVQPDKRGEALDQQAPV